MVTATPHTSIISRLFARFHEMGRDPVAESFAIRYKKLELDRIFLEFRKAYRKRDIAKMEVCKKRHEKARAEWTEMSESYTARFLADDQE